MKNIVYFLLISGLLFLNGCSLFDDYELFDSSNPPAEGEVLTFTDKRDKLTYGFVRIGDQYWMADNMKYETRKGNSYVYDNNPDIVADYGRLYDWEAACEACPEGWHLPSNAEWEQLIDYLGGDTIANGKMKELGFSNWREPNIGATNSVNFSALPGGYRFVDGGFHGMGSTSYFWSSTSYYDYIAWARKLNYKNASTSHYYDKDFYNFSVRCVMDQ